MTSPARKKIKTGHHNLYLNRSLSDVKIKFHNQKIHAHKSILATNCEYFYKAFTGNFKVATSCEIDLGDDDDVEAVWAAIRHLYDLPYDDMIDDVLDKDLSFHINVFAVADKYDIPTLRPLVVENFKALMEAQWESRQFAAAIDNLCLPGAPKFADPSLKTAAADFCYRNIRGLIGSESFCEVLEKKESFAARLLIRVLREEKGETVPCDDCRKHAVHERMRLRRLHNVNSHGFYRVPLRSTS